MSQTWKKLLAALVSTGVVAGSTLPAPALAQGTGNEQADLNVALQANNQEAYEAFLLAYPDSVFRTLVVDRLTQLLISETAPAAGPALGGLAPAAGGQVALY
ncbi:MAG: hypothetical protein H6842_06455 [Rhodospirillaceae bacterium]|nr:hypothetical protein [Rhodospirillaceae bacterium]